MTTVLTVNLAAQEQAAMHRTQLLLGRCRSHRPPCAPMALEQARWHAQRHADFLAWLDAGGLSQPVPEQHERLDPAPRSSAAAAAHYAPTSAPIPRTIENSGMAPLFSAP